MKDIKIYTDGRKIPTSIWYFSEESEKWIKLSPEEVDIYNSLEKEIVVS